MDSIVTTAGMVARSGAPKWDGRGGFWAGVPEWETNFDRGSIWEFAGSGCIGGSYEEKEKCANFNLALESVFGNGCGGRQFRLSALNS